MAGVIENTSKERRGLRSSSRSRCLQQHILARRQGTAGGSYQISLVLSSTQSATKNRGTKVMNYQEEHFATYNQCAGPWPLPEKLGWQHSLRPALCSKRGHQAQHYIHHFTRPVRTLCATTRHWRPRKTRTRRRGWERIKIWQRSCSDFCSSKNGCIAAITDVVLPLPLGRAMRYLRGKNSGLLGR